jgi:hypothetical protein
MAGRPEWSTVSPLRFQPRRRESPTLKRHVGGLWPQFTDDFSGPPIEQCQVWRIPSADSALTVDTR